MLQAWAASKLHTRQNLYNLTSTTSDGQAVKSCFDSFPPPTPDDWILPGCDEIMKLKNCLEELYPSAIDIVAEWTTIYTTGWSNPCPDSSTVLPTSSTTMNSTTAPTTSTPGEMNVVKCDHFLHFNSTNLTISHLHSFSNMNVAIITLSVISLLLLVIVLVFVFEKIRKKRQIPPTRLDESPLSVRSAAVIQL